MFGNDENEKGIVKTVNSEQLSVISNNITDRNIKPDNFIRRSVNEGGLESLKEKLLGWKAKTKFEELVKIMAKVDLEKVIKKGY